MSELKDSLARERFAREIEQSFSVIAPAGVGKTHAIIERVARTLEQTTEPLALLTYTKKAARQMRDRLEANLAPRGLAIPTRQIFIGTIHAFCLERVQKNSQAWGLPREVEVAADAEGLSARYEQEVGNPLAGLPGDVQSRHWRFFDRMPLRLLLEVEPQKLTEAEFGPPPVFAFEKLFSYKAGGRQQGMLERLQAWARDFLAAAENPEYIMPELPEAVGETSPLHPLYAEVFQPFLDWRATEGMLYARHLAWDFQEWRRKKGVYFYDDLIDVVAEHEAPSWRIVLDEAQDTSPRQIEMLKKVALRKEGKIQLTMVGDPQQSIYSGRASLQHYLQTHRELIATGGVEELTFQVTFRCPREVIGWVNEIGPGLLKESPTQARFVPLEAKPTAAEGGVFRWSLPPPRWEEEKVLIEKRDWAFARALVEKIESLKIPAGAAHQVAILGFRKEWLNKLQRVLTEHGLRAQLHADSPTLRVAQRTLRAIVHLMRRPFDHFELAGLLRELSPATDRELSSLARHNPAALTIQTPPPEELKSQALKETLTLWHRAWKEGLEMPTDRALAHFVKTSQVDTQMQALAAVYGEGFCREWKETFVWTLSLAATCKTANELLQKMESEKAPESVESGALQLMTYHKAKGLEWPVVILPFLRRPDNNYPVEYPAVDPQNKGARLTWKLKRDEGLEDENFQRLLYVAQTRAKEALILVDDGAFYEPKDCAARQLGIERGGRHHEKFMALPEGELDWGREAAIKQRPAPPQWEPPAALESLSPSDLVDEAQIYPPSPGAASLAVEEGVAGEENPRYAEGGYGGMFAPGDVTGGASDLPAGLQGESELAEGGRAYGEAWHRLWEREYEAGDWPAAVARAAQKGRLAAELAALKKTPLWEVLLAGELRAEVPFFAHADGRVLEGRVDMLIKKKDGWRLLDWKTDQMPFEKICEVYKPQMLAYKAAFEKLMSGHQAGPVEVCLYSTLHAREMIF